jgi:hypothetical protein
LIITITLLLQHKKHYNFTLIQKLFVINLFLMNLNHFHFYCICSTRGTTRFASTSGPKRVQIYTFLQGHFINLYNNGSHHNNRRFNLQGKKTSYIFNNTLQSNCTEIIHCWSDTLNSSHHTYNSVQKLHLTPHRIRPSVQKVTSGVIPSTSQNITSQHNTASSHNNSRL